jgi:hypothetical protein
MLPLDLLDARGPILISVGIVLDVDAYRIEIIEGDR